jgi:hypothetical protein
VTIHVSVVVSTVSRTLENTLHQVDVPLEPAVALKYRVDLETWL